MIWLLYACHEPALPLPPSRLYPASSGMMVQYGQLQGFLVSRGKAQKYYIWTVHVLNDKSKACALSTIEYQAQALVVPETESPNAQHYFKSKTDTPTVEPLLCP